MNLQNSIRSVLGNKGSAIWSVAPDADVYSALELMAARDIGALLVVGRDGALAGIFSERDYARRIILHGKTSRETRVFEVMTADPIFVSPEDTVEQCMRLMTDHRIRHLPVVEDGSIAGMVSIGDLVNAIIGAQKAEIEHLHAYIAGSYPA